MSASPQKILNSPPQHNTRPIDSIIIKQKLCNLFATISLQHKPLNAKIKDKRVMYRLLTKRLNRNKFCKTSKTKNFLFLTFSFLNYDNIEA